MAKRKEQLDVIEILKKKLEKYDGEASKRVPQNALERLGEFIQTEEFLKNFQRFCANNTEKDTSTAPLENRGKTYVGSIKSLFNFDS